MGNTAATAEHRASVVEAPPAVDRAPAAPTPAPAPPAHSPVAHSVPAARASRPGFPVRRIVLSLVVTAALGFGGHAGWQWWTEGRFLETTDDAYVRADITILAAKVAGYLDAVTVTDNQTVAAGDVIARIDDGDLRLALQLSRDKVDTQRSTVARIGRQMEAADAAVARAAADLDSARAERDRSAADYDRQQRLAQADYASRARLDEARAGRDRALAAVRSAEAALAEARANVDVLAAQRMEAERLIGELDTQVRRAERDLSFTVIRAPFAGVIGNKAVEAGTYVQPGQRLAALVPLDSVHIDANFKETQIANMRPGQTVRITVDAFPDRPITGRVVSVAPASGSVFSLLPPENATGNFTKIVQRVPVRVAIPGALAREGRLRPGLSAEVSVDTRGGDPGAPAVAAADGGRAG